MVSEVAGGPTVMLYACETVEPPVSVAAIVKLLVPAEVGVPEIVPFWALNVSPAGRLPFTVND